MKQLKLPGTTLKFIDTAAVEGGQNVLLVHGFPLDHTMWQYQIADFRLHHRVICPDLAGFGQSKTSRDSFSMEQMADDLAAIVESLHLEKIVFCGLSMGGYIGWQFWKRHREKLRSLIACDTRAAADTEMVARGRRMSARMVRAQGTSVVAEEMPKKLLGPESLYGQIDRLEQVKAVIRNTPPDSIAKGQIAMADRIDATAWLGEIAVPALFVVGELDQITPPGEMKSMSEQVGGSVFKTVKGAGHLPPLENPEAFNRIVKSFLDKGD